MHPDPWEVRRTGTRRVRAVTASLGAAAVVGTGMLTWAVAANAGAQDTTRQTSSAVTPGSGSTDSGSDAFPGGGDLGGTDLDGSDSSGDQFSPPQQLPGSGGFGSAHGSSGGS
jgi:hypothetical protein